MRVITVLQNPRCFLNQEGRKNLNNLTLPKRLSKDYHSIKMTKEFG